MVGNAPKNNRFQGEIADRLPVENLVNSKKMIFYYTKES